MEEFYKSTLDFVLQYWRNGERHIESVERVTSGELHGWAKRGGGEEVMGCRSHRRKQLEKPY